MSEKRNWYKLLSGEDKKKTFRRTKWQDTASEMWLEASSNYPVRELGDGTDAPLVIKEEERYHTHVIGTTQQGKSYFLRHQILQDIKRGVGVCFLDPTGLAKHANAILRYCCEIGYDKVCVIDYFDYKRRGIVPVINPLLRKLDADSGKYKPRQQAASVRNVVDSMMVLYGVKDEADVGRISYYLPAVIRVLHNADMTLYDSRYFLERFNNFYQPRRDYILSQSHPLDDFRMRLEAVFQPKAPLMTWNTFETTVRRLARLSENEVLRCIFGAREGINFEQLVAQGWVVLVNLSPSGGFGMMETRLLGVMVLNELASAVERLYHHGWRGRFSVYIDEAARFANRKVIDILAHNLQFGLQVTVAHQSFEQFEDQFVRNQIPQLCDFKVMFHTPSRNDRDRMIRDMYGGDIADRDASFANSRIPKQTAIMKPPKGDPVRVVIPEIEEAKVPEHDVEAFRKKLYDNPDTPWYHAAKDIYAGFSSRFKDSGDAGTPSVREEPRKAAANPTASRARATADHPADSDAGVSPRPKFSGWNEPPKKP